MKRIWIFTVSLTLLSISLFAQRESDPRWVFRMGLNGTDMSRNLIPYTGSVNFKPAFSVGFARNLEIIPQMLGVQVGLRYNPRGYWAERKIADTEGSTRVRSWNSLHYLDVPVDLVLQVGGQRTKVYMSAGGYLGVGVFGQNKIKSIGGAYTDTTTSGSGIASLIYEKQTHVNRLKPFKNDLSRLDYGVNFAIGIRKGYTVFGLTYSQGLANLAMDNKEAIKNRAFGLFLSYYFDDAF
ncbi:MAG: hypothetical protein QM669_09200 [Siphonobacter sp.]